MPGAESLVRAYYDALDEHAYEELTDLLAPEFVHYRPDRTFEGRAAFVSFMRDDRPTTDTTHDLERVFPGAGAHEDAVAVQGRLLDADGELLFRFADVHVVEGGAIQHVRTYTNSHPGAAEAAE